MRLRLLMVFAGAVALAGCLGGGADTPQPIECSAQNCVVYTSNGFSPTKITIEQGETVTWKSEGPEMWVASNVHPAHRGYGVDDEGTPIFDQLGVGDRYTFTFNKTGTWKYHNHVRAAHEGTVVVETQ